MQDHSDDKVIVYFLTCASVDFFHTALTQLPDANTAQLFALHGKMKQAAREAVMSAYTSSPAGGDAVLVAARLSRHLGMSASLSLLCDCRTVGFGMSLPRNAKLCGYRLEVARSCHLVQAVTALPG